MERLCVLAIVSVDDFGAIGELSYTSGRESGRVLCDVIVPSARAVVFWKL